MIQRIQTVFLLLAVAALLACLCLPIGSVEPQGMGAPAVWYNLGLTHAQGLEARPVPFVCLIVTGALTLLTIFQYRHRTRQMRFCVACMVLCALWYAYYLFSALVSLPAGGATFHVRFAACLPLVAIILLALAHRGIKADERLVKSMDRIR